MKSINYSPELEQRVLETLMHHGDSKEPSIQKAMLNLTTDSFYRMEHQALFAMIRNAFNNDEPFTFVDILVLIPREDNDLYMSLHTMIQEYMQMPLSAIRLEHDISRLNLLMRLRKQMTVAQAMIQEVSDCRKPEEAQEILSSALTEISGLCFLESKSGISNIELAELFYDGKLGVELIHPTTCEQLNAVNGGGIMAKSFITVAAGAGVGKTGFAIYLMDAIARVQVDTQALFFSLEMEAKQIWMRHVALCGGKQFDKLEESERFAAVTKAMQVPTQIYDASMCKSAADIEFILTTARLRAMDKRVSVIVVDYLGLVDAKGKFESNALKQTEITNQLARLAIELDCVVIALSQINRSPSARATDDRCPYPSDASGSSGSYFSSTLWLGVDRPELYQDDLCYRNQFVIKCRKNRFGGTFDLILAFNEGTFAEVPSGWFKYPTKQSKSPEQSLFSAQGKDFSEKQYVG